VPTAAKLFAGFALAAVCFLTAQLIRPYLPPGTQAGSFAPISALIGLFSGWRVVGPDTGKGSLSSFLAGLRGAVFAALVAVIIFAVIEMARLSWRGTYDGPFQAVLGIVDLAVGYVPVLFKPDVAATLLIGAGLSGVFAEWAARRWR